MADGRIGPYRLERKLGSGGMGEVYAAWDERLERRVALKRIRPDAAGDPLRRRRFEREARAVARLNHPAVVQVHDLLETPAGVWIVTEYVDGETVARRLRRGALAADEVAALARDVLGALVEAHERGVLHRDLKSENVMLTPSGRAKVLDFGVAKLLEQTPVGGTADSTAGIVGTYRAMSPEQANGLPLDARSDLFSLGVLLYESATGLTPFQADRPVATLARVCGHLQAPAGELNPALPEPLSRWIDALLEKDPARRPASAREARALLDQMERSRWVSPPAAEPATTIAEAPADLEPALRRMRPSSTSPYRRVRQPLRRLGWTAALSAAAVAGGAVGWRSLATPEPLYVVVARPETREGPVREEVALATSAWHAALLRHLSSLEGVAALDAGPPHAGETSPPARELAFRSAADEVVASSLECRARRCLGVLRRLRGADGSVLDLQRFEVPLDDLHLLETAVATHLRRAYAGRPVRPGNPALQVDGESYRQFLRLVREWEVEGSADLDSRIAELEEIRARSPLFLDALLLEARMLGRRFFATRREEDLTLAVGLIERARTVAPGDPLPLFTLFDLAVATGRADLAGQALAETEAMLPGDLRVLRQRAFLSELRGDGERALQLMNTAVERGPSIDLMMDLASLAMRQGETSGARRALEDLLDRAPGNPRAQRLLAQIELETGSPARAVELYRDLVSRSPEFADLSNLGLAQLLGGRYDDAAASLGRAYSLAPESAAAALNLADAERLRGRLAAARALYRRTLDLVAVDPAPDFWQTLSIQAQALAHLGRAADAASAIQRAILAAPDNPQVAYEAALVYTVIGDSASALASAERALAAGYAPRWFSLPWFEPLRDAPVLRSRLAAEIRAQEAR